jgi:hypothetical protein
MKPAPSIYGRKLLSTLLDWGFRSLRVPDMVEAALARGQETANDGP